MPIDAYSLCPGGTGKKIKFCCPDLLGELPKIQRMLEGEQPLACLQHVDRLLQQKPDRACLLAIKGSLLRVSGQLEAAAANAARFLEKHPDNATALAESAMVTAAVEGGRAGMQLLQRAIAGCSDGIVSRVYEAMGDVADALLADGQLMAGRALLQLQVAISQDNQDPAEALFEFNRAPGVPLLLKDDPPMDPCPGDAPWKARYEEAMAPIAMACWQAAADRLGALAAEVPDSPLIWRNLATLRGWLADTPGCIAALERFAALDVPLEDAVEAEALAMILSEDPLADRLDVVKLAWTVKDSERLQAALLSEPRVVSVTVDPGAFGEGDSPPPKAAYVLLDRPLLKSAENITLDTLSNSLGEVLFYGRQTDREARLEVLGVAAVDLPRVQNLLTRLDGEALQPDAQEERVGQLSASQKLLQRRWLLPRDVSRQQVQALTAEHQQTALLERWPQLPLGVFGGKSPSEAAAEPALRIKLLAAIMWLSVQEGDETTDFDFNQLRSRLGLPTLGPIDPRQAPAERLPLARLSRVNVAELHDEALVRALRRALLFHVTEAMRKFAQAIIDRPGLAAPGERLRAYRTLAEIATEPEQALRYIEEGRRAAESAGESSAAWDLWELRLRFALGEGQQALRLIRHVESQHIQERGVAEALTHLLVQMGILRPDGTPAMPQRPQQLPPHPDEEPQPEPGKLWTPGSQEPGGERKLWVPE